MMSDYKKYIAHVDMCKHCPNFSLYNRDNNYTGYPVVYVCQGVANMQLILEKEIDSFPEWCPMENVDGK